MVNTGAIHYVVRMNLAEENVQKFKETAAELVACSQAEAGNIYYCLTANKKFPNQLVFLECWKDKEAIVKHNESEHFQRILPQLLALCAEPPVKETYLEG